MGSTIFQIGYILNINYKARQKDKLRGFGVLGTLKLLLHYFGLAPLEVTFAPMWHPLVMLGRVSLVLVEP